MQVTQILGQAVMEQPGSVGTIYGERQRTWAEIGARVPRLAAALQALGVRRGDRVSALALNSDRYVELFFAIPWAGAAFAPLNIRWSVVENAFALQDAEVEILFVDDEFLGMGEQLRDSLTGARTLIYMGERATPPGMLAYDDLIDGHAPVPDAGRRGDDLYAVLYTSGTTVRSKGVQLSHRNVVYVALCFLATLPSRDDLRHMHVGGMFHLSGALPTWYITLAGGSHVVLPKFEPEPVMRAISTHQVTSGVLVPTMVNSLLHHPDLRRYDLSSMRICCYGGAPMPEPVMEGAMAELPTWGFHQQYGMTETAGYATALRWSDHLAAVAGPCHRLRSAGRPVPGIQVRTVTPDFETAGVRETGEIVIRGDNVMTGYFRNPDATAESLQDGWMHTGDAGYVDEDGFVYVSDRIKDMILSGGENVFSVDVERALYQHAAVREAAVIGIPHDHWGEAVHAVVVLKDGVQATQEELVEHCRGLIGGYKVPRSVEFRAEPLPTTPVGKIRKNVLRAPYWSDRDRKI
jgi:long-chain acyl-CoA synthetase